MEELVLMSLCIFLDEILLALVIFEMEAKQAFDLCDTNSDGRIDRNELKMYFSNIGIPISDKELDNMMHIADTDRSGYVEFEEFINMMTG